MLEISFIALLFLRLTLAVEFSCDNLSAADCKNKFGKEFEQQALALQIKAAREIFENYINQTSEAKKELGVNNPYVKVIEANIENLQVTLKNLSKADANEQERIIEIISNGMSKLSVNTGDKNIDKNATRQIQGLFVKNGIIMSLANSVRQFVVNLSNIWSEMYKNLREQDLKEFPVYKQIDAYMQSARDEGQRQEKLAQFVDAKKLLLQHFQLQLFKEDNSFLLG